jgi:hypothetical protein
VKAARKRSKPQGAGLEMENNWEHVEGTGKADDIEKVIADLQAIEKVEGNIPVNFRNYLEENVVAPVTTMKADHGMVVFESDDLPANEDEDESQ